MPLWTRQVGSAARRGCARTGPNAPVSRGGTSLALVGQTQEDIFAKDLILVPVHLGVHWSMATVDMRRKPERVEYYDSLSNDNDECLKVRGRPRAPLSPACLTY